MQLGWPTSTFVPSWAVICWIGVGVQYMPSPASVAYAFAMSSGVDAVTPRVKAPQLCAEFGSFAISASSCARNWTPKRFATSTTFSAPTCSCSGTK